MNTDYLQLTSPKETMNNSPDECLLASIENTNSKIGKIEFLRAH